MRLDMINPPLTPEQRSQVNDMLLATAKLEYERGAEANGWAALFRGAARSWTCWFSTVLAAYWTYSDKIDPLLVQAFGPKWTDAVIPLLGVVSIALRIKTNQSLEAKGS